MAYEIFLTRTAVPGTDIRFEHELGPLTNSDFQLIMDGAPIRKRLDDGACWLWHPQNMPWLSASWQKGRSENSSYISLAVSYAHNQFLKVWADAFALALRLGHSLNARIFEDSKHLEITRENVEEVLAPHGQLVTEQAKFWEEAVTGMDRNMQAPLEYPMGPYDAVKDFFVLFLDPEKRSSMIDVVRDLNLYIDPESLAADRFAIQAKQNDNLLARVLVRPNDGALQIRPFYWMEPFQKTAPATLDLAKQLQSRLGGSLYLKEKPMTTAFEDEIRNQINGLGVEFLLWLEARK
jgi:hypothetical protein